MQSIVAALALGLLLLAPAPSPGQPASERVHPRDSQEVFLASDAEPDQAGNRLLDLVQGLSPEVNRPVRIRLGPGPFDLGERRLVLPPYVDLEGSGARSTTLVSSARPPGSSASRAAVQLSRESSLGQLQLLVSESSSGGVTALEVSGGSPRLHDLEIRVEGHGGAVTGLVLAVDSTPRLSDVSLEVTGLGTAEARGTVLAGGASPYLVRSRLTVQADRGNTRGMILLGGNRCELLDVEVEAQAAHASVHGIVLGPGNHLVLASSRVTSLRGRWNHAIRVEGRGNRIELRSAQVLAKDGQLGTAALHLEGSGTEFQAFASRLIASSPRQSRGVEASRGRARLEFDTSHVEGRSGALQTGPRVQVESRCSSFEGGTGAVEGKLRCRSCGGVPLRHCP